MALDVLEFGVAALKPLCVPEGFDSSRIGEMTTERWSKLIEQMTEVDLIPSGSMPPAYVFTTEFLTASEKQNEPDKSPAR
jgi:NitT/TauT family transport system substrate-binding protein